MEQLLQEIPWSELAPWMGAVGVGVTALYYVVKKVFETPDKEKKSSDKVTAKKHVELKDALINTRSSFLGRIKDAFANSEDSLESEIEALEEILYTSDIGPQAVQKLVESVSEQLNESDRGNVESVVAALKSEMLKIFQGSQGSEGSSQGLSLINNVDQNKPTVWMVVGVNGAGKTTTIGKLAHLASTGGLKTMVVAGDTFRAAAGDQLKVWSDRAEVEIFSPEGVSDPSAVAFDGVQKAKAQGYDLVIIDTAGRLHTQDNLMEELKKMKRVMKKVLEQAPHETLIVLDSNSGQNALVQVEKFNEALDLTGAILTKLDGTAKGGVAIGLAYEFKLPIKVIGVGEGVEDLRPFQAKDFVDSIL